MNIFLLLTLPILFIGLMIITPTLINLIRARTMGVQITFNDSWTLTRNKASNKDFLNGLLEFQKNGIEYNLKNLIAHYFAGGNLKNCVRGFVYAKENKLDTDFLTISVIDLTGKNVETVFKESNKLYKIQINELYNNRIEIKYHVEYKYQFPSPFEDKSIEKTKERILKKLTDFLDSWNSNDPIETENMIRNNILNTDYFEGNLRIIMIKQGMIIRRK